MLPEPPDGYQDKKFAEPLLNRFVKGGQYEGLVALPKRADPTFVDEFVKKTLEGDELDDRQVSRCGELMRFYALNERVEQLPKLLDKRERQAPQLERSLTAVALLGDLGDDAQQKQAADYYAHLTGHYLAPQYYARLVDLFFHLPEGADEQMIARPISTKMSSLQPKIESDEDAAVAYYELEDLQNDRLPTVLQAKKRKHELLKLKDMKRKRRDAGRCYLRFDRNAYVDLRTWAAMILQLDCKATEPPQLATAFSDGFELLRTSATRKGVLAPGDKQDLKKYVTSCARAVEFYHGQLNEEQSEYAKEHCNAEQNDILYWEPEESKEATGQPPSPKPKEPAAEESEGEAEKPTDEKPEGK